MIGKKICLLLALTCMLCLVACGKSDDNKVAKTTPNIIATQSATITPNEDNQEPSKTDNGNKTDDSNINSDANKNNTQSTSKLYRVRPSKNNRKEQIGAYKDLESAKKICDSKPGYRVYDDADRQVYAGILDNLDKNQGIIFVPDEQLMYLYPMVVTLESNDVHGIIKALIKQGVLKDNTKVIKYTKEGDSATVDMSKEFIDLINYYGTSGEGLTINALVYSITNYLNLDYINITYNSKTIETGHNIYDEPLYFGKYTGELNNKKK